MRGEEARRHARAVVHLNNMCSADMTKQFPHHFDSVVFPEIVEVHINSAPGVGPCRMIGKRSDSSYRTHVVDRLAILTIYPSQNITNNLELGDIARHNYLFDRVHVLLSHDFRV